MMYHIWVNHILFFILFNKMSPFEIMNVCFSFTIRENLMASGAKRSHYIADIEIKMYGNISSFKSITLGINIL